MLLENLEHVEQAEQVARDVLVAFETPLDIDQRHDVVISPSIGISLYPDHALVPTDLLKHADTAMYQAKAAGRRTFMRYTEAMDVEIRGRATISAALRGVLDRNELRLVFQPKLSLDQSRITGVEALLRWRSFELGDISPAQFIPLAEESGLILDIGEWALREACSVLKRWRHNGLDQLTHGGQRVVAAAAARQPAQAGRTRAGRKRRAAGDAAAGADRKRDHGQRRRRPRRRWMHCARSASAWRSTTSAPVTRRWPTSSACRSTRSRSTRNSSAT